MFYKEGGFSWFILAGETKLMQYKLVFEHFQERVEGYQEMSVSLNWGSIQSVILQSKELIFTTWIL